MLYDIIGGEYRGWPAIRAYFGQGRQRYPDLVLEPTGDFWSRPDGLAMLWTMSATQTRDDLGPELVGRRWTVEGMSYLTFDDLTVIREADYHDAGSRERSLRKSSGRPGFASGGSGHGVSSTARRRKRRCTATPMASRSGVGRAVRRNTSSAVRLTQAPFTELKASQACQVCSSYSTPTVAVSRAFQLCGEASRRPRMRAR